ncbi:hypothetical protein C7E25_11945 [Stenotrophomonas maltophilia]|nr:hypothetical protein C7E25_11945 [Stenotrophomonas maltophilia]
MHGQATVDVALEQQTLEFGLQAPGIGILDYERPPANAAEQAALARATSLLKGGNWVTLPTAAGCRLATSKADAEGFDATAAAPPPVMHRDTRHLGQRYEDNRGQQYGRGYKKKKKDSFLSELFDF